MTSLEAAGSDAQTADVKADPLERIARNFDAVAFRQAAQMLDQVDEARLTALTPQLRAQKLAAQAKDYLDRGLLLEAERLYLTAVAIDDRVPEVHAGLAEVRERTGDKVAARKEARTSLELMPSVQAYLVMGRLDLAAANRLDEAGRAAGEALQAATLRAMRRRIAASRLQARGDGPNSETAAKERAMLQNAWIDCGCNRVGCGRHGIFS